MKIKHILNEDNDSLTEQELNYSVDIILNSEYYKHNKENMLKGENLYHGTNNIYADIAHKDINDRREPRDTHNYIHDITNQISEEKFGIKIRNKLFVSTSRATADTYGSNIFVIIPVGDYDIYYSETIDDMYTNRTNIISFKEIFKEIYSLVFKELMNTTDEEKYNLNSLLSSDIDNILNNNKDFTTKTIITPLNSRFYSQAAIGDDAAFEAISEAIYKTLFRVVFEKNSSQKFKVLDYLESYIPKLMSKNKEEIISLIKRNIYSGIKQNYIDTITQTKTIGNLDLSSECMLDTEEALFINDKVMNKVISEVKKRDSYES